MTTEINQATIETKVKNLAESRRVLEGRKRKVLDLNKRLEEVELYQWLMEAQTEVNQAFASVEEAEHDLREAVLTEHQATGEKQYPGAQVRIYTVRKYNPLAARVFCIDHKLDAALKLDKRQFENIADIMKPGFVVFLEEPKVFIDGDLSRFLDVES